MQDRRCFVQFIHPGGEHRPDHDGRKRWNRGKHKRKFFKSPGRYIHGGQKHEGDIVFWGEWEPESRLLAKLKSPEPDGPRFLYEPYYVTPPSYNLHQNTDPFVFGDQFHYTCCLQHTRRGPTQLRRLERGSVILFGSCVDKSRFVLDTVFVVGECQIDHSAQDPRPLIDVISETYRIVTIDALYRGNRLCPGSHRLYFGATADRPVEGMFSFFPCQTFTERSSGFARPKIDIDGFITPNLMMGKKIARDLSLGQLKELWDRVVTQVTQKQFLGVHAELPPKRVP